MNALVVFTNENQHPLAGWLRPGYRHVFCIVPAFDGEGGSVFVNLTLGGLEVAPLEAPPEAYRQEYADDTETLLVPHEPWKRRQAPLALNNCVAITKQLIGLRSWAWTPWQLRCHLSSKDMPCSLPASA